MYVQNPSIREVGRDPLREREHRHVQREVQPEREDHDGSVRIVRISFQETCSRSWGLPRRGGRAPAPDRHAVEHPVDDDQRQGVDAPEDEQPHQEDHARELAAQEGGCNDLAQSFWSFIAAPMSPLIFQLAGLYAVVGFCSPATIFSKLYRSP